MTSMTCFGCRRYSIQLPVRSKRYGVLDSRVYAVIYLLGSTLLTSNPNPEKILNATKSWYPALETTSASGPPHCRVSCLVVAFPKAEGG